MSKRVLCICAVLAVINSIIFADVYDDSKVYKISGGENHSMALTSDNALWICGSNGGGDSWYSWYGVLGTDDDLYGTHETILVRVHDGDMNTTSGYIEDVVTFDAGWKHSLAVDSNGFVWAWGHNQDGQLGINSDSIVNALTPVLVHSGSQNGGDYLVGIESVAAGRSGSHSLAVDCNEQVLAWGNNESGQLGIGSDEDEALEPNYVVAVSGAGRLNDIVAVSAGEDNSIALDEDGYVFTFGNNDHGKLGIDANSTEVPEVNMPVEVVSGEQDPSNEKFA